MVPLSVRTRTTAPVASESRVRPSHDEPRASLVADGQAPRAREADVLERPLMAAPAEARFEPVLPAEVQLRLSEQQAIRAGEKPFSEVSRATRNAPDFNAFVTTLFRDLAQNLAPGATQNNAQVFAKMKLVLDAAPAVARDPEFGEAVVKLFPEIYALLPRSTRAVPAVAAAALNPGTGRIATDLVPASLRRDADFLRGQARDNPRPQWVGTGFSSDLELFRDSLHHNPQTNVWATDALKARPEYAEAFKNAVLGFRPRSKALTRLWASALPPAAYGDLDVMVRLVRSDAARFHRASAALQTEPRLRRAFAEALRAGHVSSLLSYAPGDFPADLLRDPQIAADVASKGGYALLEAGVQAEPVVARAFARGHLPSADYPDPSYVPALASMSAALRDDPETVVTAVISDPANLEHASKRLRDDLAVVRTAVDLEGTALEWAGPAARDDHDTVLLACRQDGDALAFASPRLKLAPDITAAAVESSMSRPGWDPDRGRAFEQVPPDAASYVTLAIRAGKVTAGMLASRDPAWNTKPEVVLDLLRNGAPAATVLDTAHGGIRPKLYSSPDFVKKLALNVGPDVLRWLPSGLANDRQVQTYAALGLSDELSGIPPELHPLLEAEPEVALALVKRNHWRYYELPAPLQASPEIAAEAIANDEGLVTNLPASVQNKLPLLRDLTAMNPRALDQLLPGYREALVGKQTLQDPRAGAYRDLAVARARIDQELAELGIQHPERFAGEWQTLKQLLHTRKTSPQFDSRPTALMNEPAEDWDQGFIRTGAKELLESGHQVHYYEVETLAQNLANWDELGRVTPLDYVNDAGHGSYSDVAYGDNDPEIWDPSNRSVEAMDLTALPRLEAHDLRDRTAKNANVVLQSCETARFTGVSGHVYRDNILGMLHRALPEQNVWGPTVSVSDAPRFERGRFVDPGYSTRSGNTIRLRPTR